MKDKNGKSNTFALLFSVGVMKIHFIAIGGTIMHNLALALHSKGYVVSGSDDEIFEPSASRLAAVGLLPKERGWFPEKITPDIDTIILGMHAREDNPELIQARKLGLKIMSFPEYMYEQTKNRLRVVVAGSHGKTTITAMIMHVLRHCGANFDYLVGSQIEGFDTMVGLSDSSTLAIFEGDEYLTSPLDLRPKFHLYMPDIAIINGIAWDHQNVFPTFGNYTEQFEIFIDKIAEKGTLLFYEGDPHVKQIVDKTQRDIQKIGYTIHPYQLTEQGVSLITPQQEAVPIQLFGEHNMQNISAALGVCRALGISDNNFYSAISTFSGTKKRLQKIVEDNQKVVYLDFAHSPSKVKATLEAVRQRYPHRPLIACLEIHTFSSLNIEFLPQYEGTMQLADRAYLYFNPHAIELKNLPPIDKEDIKQAFNRSDLKVYDNAQQLFAEISREKYNSPVYLFMSSGNFNGQFNPNLF